MSSDIPLIVPPHSNPYVVYEYYRKNVSYGHITNSAMWASVCLSFIDPPEGRMRITDEMRKNRMDRVLSMRQPQSVLFLKAACPISDPSGPWHWASPEATNEAVAKEVALTEMIWAAFLHDQQANEEWVASGKYGEGSARALDFSWVRDGATSEDPLKSPDNNAGAEGDQDAESDPIPLEWAEIGQLGLDFDFNSLHYPTLGQGEQGSSNLSPGWPAGSQDNHTARTCTGEQDAESYPIPLDWSETGQRGLDFDYNSLHYPTLGQGGQGLS